MRPLSAAAFLLALLPFLGCGGAPADTPATPLERAAAAVERGELETAAHELQAAFDAGDHSVAVVDALARVWLELEEIPKAVRVLRAGLEAHPGSGTLAARLGGVMLSIGQAEEARRILTEARAAGASDAEGVALLFARVHGALGEYDAAREELERARAAGEDPVDVDYLAGLLEVAQGRPAEALALLERASEGRPDDLEILRERERARLAAHPGDPEAAAAVIEALDRVLAELPEDWRAYSIVGDAYMALDDPDAALAHYLKALEYGRNPPSVEERYRRAKIASNQKLRAMGLEPPDAVRPQDRRDAPPLPASLEDYEGFWHRDG